MSRGKVMSTFDISVWTCAAVMTPRKTGGCVIFESSAMSALEGFDCVFKGDETTGTCQVPTQVAAGLDCSADNAVCAEGFYCNGDNCIGGQSPGEACTVTRECNNGYCNAGTCVAHLEVNVACSSDEQCESGLCYQFTATEQVCADRVRLSRNEPICEDLR